MGNKKRMYDRRVRNNKWKDFVSKIDDFEVKIIAEFEDRKEARRFEKKLIDEVLPCCNIWTKHYKFSEESNLKRAIKIKNRPISDETRRRMSIGTIQKIKKQKENGTYKPRPRPSNEEILNTIKRSSIPIICLNDGMIYNSSRDAGRRLGICFKLINRVANGQRKHTHGYFFKKLSDHV